MAIETFRTQIARNKRNSWILIFIFLLFFAGLGTLIGYIWGGGNWYFGFAVAGIAASIAFVMVMISYFAGGSALVGMSGAKRLKKEHDPQLFNVVEELSLAGGIPIPKIYLIESPAMNAFATGRNVNHAAVAITRGLREKLTREELQGVMAHELSHVRHYDILFSMMIAVLVGTVIILCDIFLRSMWFGGGRSRSRSNKSSDSGGGAAIYMVLLILALLLAVIAPLLAKLIQMSLSRQREYLADAGSVELTRNPAGLASALAKLGADKEILKSANRVTAPLYIVHPVKSFEKRASGFFNTHPPLKDRIKKLKSIGA